jgi:aldehyde:ferredoxin oxidoreductase
MTAGYAGKILSIDLTKRSITVLDTEQYEEYGGGNGFSSALFWELCEDKAISGFDPRNVVTVTTGPLAGTLAPGANRTEICGISPFSYPIEWFSRSNIGGFFGAMLKYAGWDGIVIKGKADKPVWVNIVNDKVTIEDADGLWGLDTLTTQEEIWKRVTGRESFGEWLSLDRAQTTQGPSVLCIGQGGESLSRMGTIQSGLGMGAGQGGFGGVWGSKNLKALSVIGTGGIRVAEPKALLAARQWLSRITEQKPEAKAGGRQTSCVGCFQKCKSRSQSGVLNDAQCLDRMFITDDLIGGKSGSDIIQMYGLNLNDLTNVALTDGPYIKKLYDMGVLGRGRAIDSAPLPMEKFGTAAFAEALCQAIVHREGVGRDLAEGLVRAARNWGRLEQDLKSGLLHKAHWGYGWHWSLPWVEQAYGSLVGDREVTEHFLSSLRVVVFMNSPEYAKLSPDKIVEMLSKKLVPYADDPFLLDYTWQEADGSKMKQALATGVYSRHRAKLVAWHRHYTRFWTESIMYCDWIWPIWFSQNSPDLAGLTPEAEPKLFNAVTGKGLTFTQGMEIGRRIWNLNRAIWVLQGRHRDMENFAGFMYTPAGSYAQTVGNLIPLPPLPVFENGKWSTARLENMYLDRAGVEQWKTYYYELEGWDPATGWPTRNTLAELGLKNVADALKSAGKLGSPG